MNVASCHIRHLITASIFLCFFKLISPMTMDSRYFPWQEHLYTTSDHNHSIFSIDPFCIFADEAFRYENKANKNEQVSSIQGLWGDLRLKEVAHSLVLAGKPDPIPAEWQSETDILSKFKSSFEGQGISISFYKPVSKHFGIGSSAAFMNLTSLSSIVPSDGSIGAEDNTIDKLQLQLPGNKTKFQNLIKDIYKEANIKTTTLKAAAFGDTVLYGSLHDVFEYRYKMRKVDCGVLFGLIIPTGKKNDPYNLASVPFDGNGMWGLFAEPRAELELKEDLKVGIHGRITQRAERCSCQRIPINREYPLLSPMIGEVQNRPGTTVSFSLYGAFDSLNRGFGAMLKYNLNYHSSDVYEATLSNKNLSPKFEEMEDRSRFTSEYGTIKLFYDIAHDKDWDYHPVVNFRWDIPSNLLYGRAFVKTHRISIGCSVNF